MKAFNRTVRERLIALAREDGLHPATYLAVVEVESAGRPFLDNNAPIFLFERHVFFKTLSGAERQLAVNAGLAHKGWRRKTQYVDQRTDTQKLVLIDRARALNTEAANQACSWGVGQVMGSNAKDLGYDSATAMVEAFATIEGQVEGMVRFCRTNKLLGALKRQDWGTFALRYNGQGYRRNGYDTKLRAAFARWAAKVTVMETPVGDLRAAQDALKANGYHQVGIPDGKPGPRTTGTIAAIQKDAGLPVTGELDAATEEALVEAPPAPTREGKPVGSKIVAKAKAIKGAAVAAGGAAAAAAADDPLAAAEKAGSLVGRIKDILEPFAGVSEMLAAWWPLGAVAAAGTLFYLARGIEADRVADHIEGKTS